MPVPRHAGPANDYRNRHVGNDQNRSKMWSSFLFRRYIHGSLCCSLVISTVLLLTSVTFLHSRISLSSSYQHQSHRRDLFQKDNELKLSNNPEQEASLHRPLLSGYHYDQSAGVIRRFFDLKHSIDSWDDDADDQALGFAVMPPHDEGKASFGSDDLPVDPITQRKVGEVKSMEVALLIEKSRLREGWGDWLDKKGEFLKKDRMFRSSVEVLNPMNNLLLQDPDTQEGTNSLSKGDLVAKNWWMAEFKRVPFVSKSSKLKLFNRTRYELIHA